MSRVIAPLAIVSGQNNLVGNQFSDLSLVRSVIIANISPFALYITGVDTERWLQPMEVDRFACANGLAQLNGAATQIFTSSSFPANSCLVTLLYESDPDPGGAYPFALGSGSVSLTQPTQVINDGFPLGTIVLETTPLGALNGGAQSYVIIKNDGTFQVWTNSNGTLTQQINVTPGDALDGALTWIQNSFNALRLIDVLSASGPAAHFTFSFGASTFFIQCSAVNGTGYPIVFSYNTPGGAQGSALKLNTDGSVEILVGPLKVDAGGLTVGAGGAAITGNSQVTGTLGVSQLLTASLGVALTTGQITRVSHFAGTGPGAVAHGLGTTPDIVLVMPNSSSAQSWAVNSIGATNCTIAIGAGIVWTALAIKF